MPSDRQPNDGPGDRRRNESRRAEREAKEREANEREEREAKEREVKQREAKERETKERETKEREAKEREAKERETKEREAKERETKEREQREAKERETKEREQREAKEREQREAKERETKEREQREAKEREQREAREREEREAKEREAKEREAKEREQREAKEREQREAKEREQREAKEREQREAKEREQREAKEREERERHELLERKEDVGISRVGRASREPSGGVGKDLDNEEGDAEPDKEKPVGSVVEPETDVPLALFPVRLETRFGVDAEGSRVLRIRIFPDDILVDDGLDNPTAAEVEAAQHFWKFHHDAADERERHAAWRWFAERVSPHRAGPLARLCRPTLDAQALRFPDVTVAYTETAGVARLLPERFVALGYVGSTRVLRKRGRRLDARPYHTSPDLSAVDVDTTDLGLTVTEQMRWMVDFVDAESRGMAITVPLGDTIDHIDTLLVVGLRQTSAAQGAEELGALLDSHVLGRGLGFVSQATPTNNTDTVESGWTRRSMDGDELAGQFERELSDRVDAKPYENASRFSTAFGLTDADSLRRLPNGADPERQRGRAVRTLLFDTVIGRYLRELLATNSTPLLSDGAFRELRSWFSDHVVGGAPIATIAVANQPYGVIPAMVRRPNDDVSTIARRVDAIVDELHDEWLTSLYDRVPRLDHNAGEAGGVVGDISAVLAGEPHPVDLELRGADEFRVRHSDFDRIGIGAVATTFGSIGVVPTGREIFWREVDNGFVGEFDEALAQLQAEAPEVWQELQQIDPYGGNPPDVFAQLDQWDYFREMVEIFGSPQGPAGGPQWMIRFAPEAWRALPIVEEILSRVAAHEQRQRPISMLDLPGFDGVLGRDNPDLVVTRFDTASRPLARTIAEEGVPVEQRRYDHDSLRRALQGLLTDDELADAPLLHQLLAASSPQLTASGWNQRSLRAIDELEGVEPDELAWLTRETLGLGMHRLDAWHTAPATARLFELRERRPRGIHTGCYGWVTDLRASIAAPSRGFVHAPSMDLAATAAVVRSGWQTRGDDNADSPAAIDLRSNRYRLAEWLLEGVRNGQELGSLLGYQFERLAHDLSIDEQIARVRDAVGRHHGRSNGIEDPVDGLELSELYAQKGLEQYVSDQIAEFGQRTGSVLRLLFEGLSWSFDAVDDALVAEAAHHLLGGNHERASAVIESTKGGDVAPAELVAMRRTERTVNVEHSVIVLAPANARPSGAWMQGTRDRLAPWLESLVEQLLPAPSEVGLVSVGIDGATQMVTLDQLPISALDAVMLGSDDPTTITEACRFIAATVTGEGVIDASQRGSGSVSFEEFQVVAIEVRRLISEQRAVGPADLADVGAPDVPAPMVNAREWLRPWWELSSKPLLDGHDRLEFARLGLVGADERIQARLHRQLGEAVDARSMPEADLAHALLGRRLPLAASIDLDGIGWTFDPELAGPHEIDDWLDVVGRVRADVGRLVTIDLLGGVLGVQQSLTAVSGQSPHEPGEPWAATGLPQASTGGRRVVTALWAGSTATPTGSVVGLHIDRWSEAIPSDQQVTGVTLHYDAPSQRPPQAIIIGVPPDGERWSLGLVAETLLDTMKWMKLRAVAPEDLGDFGHDIPTTFTTASTRVGAIDSEDLDT